MSDSIRWRLQLVVMVSTALAVGCAHDTTGPGTPNKLGSDDISIGMPEAWTGTGTSNTYNVGLDRTNRHGGTAAGFIEGFSASASSPAALIQSVNVASYLGKRVRWSAWVKAQGVSGSIAGLWMGVFGPGVLTSFDDMTNRRLIGTTDWQQVSIVLDVAQNSVGIAFGLELEGNGVLLIDDGKFEIVGTDVASTNTLAAPIAADGDSASLADAYSRFGSAPANLDFEGVSAVPSTAAAWLATNGFSLSTTDPTASLSDLQPLIPMVGSAHLIGLGEGTHGTREFFLMKHRMLELLVKQLGVTYFAMEASSPESDDLNQYVLNGVGDPKKLLSGLNFWTWNTQEVLDMIQWMLSWNVSAPANQRVQFLGFDMQSPGAAIDSVLAFIGRVDPSYNVVASADYACLGPFRNHGSTLGSPPTQYAAQSASVKAACAAALQQVYARIDSSSAAYTAASSPIVYESVKHDARLVQEFEAMAAGTYSRDQSMAENVQWIRDHAPAGARIVLWAHNGHIARVRSFMGSYLDARYGSDYVTLGFAFGHGHFNSVGANGSLQSWDAELIQPNSLEEALTTTGKQLALFDMRSIPAAGAAAAPLTGPIPMRSIGALFDPSLEATYFANAFFPGDFDLLVYVNVTSPSTLLPFVN